MEPLFKDATLARKSVEALLHRLGSDSLSATYPKTLSDCPGLKATLESAFAISLSSEQVAKMKRTIRRFDWKCEELNSKLAVERGDRVSNRGHAMWLVRTCLPRPALSFRSFEEFSRDFPAE
eukprot:7132168-Pyramimonas_sp.AAC.1